MNDSAGAPVLEVKGLTKTFPGVIANEDVSLTLERGEIHCLLGENGAGKSTLVNSMFGLYQPDAGEILLHGEPVRFTGSRDAIARGIGMVHQHFQLIPVFSVAENVMLGDELTKNGLLDIEEVSRRIDELSRTYGLAVEPKAMVGDLSVGEQQRVELIKALFRNADILILDEPTAVLTPGEVDEFFGVVRTLVNQGKSIIFITHKLREVLAVADRVTVLRGGKVVGSADPAESTEQSLANLMVGRDVVFDIAKAPATPGRTVLSVRELHVDDDRDIEMVSGVSLELRAGEIFGIAGVQGNGQRELVEAVTGMRPKTGGQVMVDDIDTTKMNPRQVTELGVGHIPEDRTKHGLVGPFSIADNLVLNRYHRPPFSRRKLRNDGAIAREAEALVAKFDVRTPGIDVPVDNLSGGNKQKVIVARELSHAVRVLIAAQPTRGLDVGSIEFIHQQIIDLRDQGTGVLLVSAELDEILSLSDRIGVLYRGRIVGTFDRDDVTRERLGFLMATGQAPELEGVGQ